MDANTQRHHCDTCLTDFYVKLREVMVMPHQNKECRFVEALSKHFMVTEAPSRESLFCLTDYDMKSRQYLLEKYRNHYGIERFFIYPHSARPPVMQDIYPAWVHTTAQFVASDGHAEILRRFGYKKPVHVVGWHLSPILPFKKCEKPHKILFAPIHPRMSYVDKQINHAAFEKLYPLARSGKIDLTVRYIASLEKSGLKQLEGIRYVRGEQDSSFAMIDEADLVISHQTFAFMAVARGVPTLMMSEETPPHDFKGDEMIYVPSWYKYKDLMMYPLDLLADGDAYELMQRAGESDHEIADWRKRMIGKPFNQAAFLDAVQSYL